MNLEDPLEDCKSRNGAGTVWPGHSKSGAQDCSIHSCHVLVTGWPIFGQWCHMQSWQSLGRPHRRGCRVPGGLSTAVCFTGCVCRSVSSAQQNCLSWLLGRLPCPRGSDSPATSLAQHCMGLPIMYLFLPMLGKCSPLSCLPIPSLLL